MTQQLVPCLVCGRLDHSSASCTHPLAGAMQRAAQQPQAPDPSRALAARGPMNDCSAPRREPR